MCNKCDSYLHRTWGRAAKAGLLPPAPFMLNIGANLGKWALEAFENLPAATVHSFELVPSTFKLLSAVHAEAAPAVRSRWTVHGVGMARVPGNYRIIDYGPGAEIGVLYGDANFSAVADAAAPATIVAVDTVANWIDANLPADQYIDLLAIDAEGSDGDIILGADMPRNAHRIGSIMFEYGGGWVNPHSNPSNHSLMTVLTMLEGLGFECFALAFTSLFRVTPSFWRDPVEWYQGPNIFCPKVTSPLYLVVPALHGRPNLPHHTLCHVEAEGRGERMLAVAPPWTS